MKSLSELIEYHNFSRWVLNIPAVSTLVDEKINIDGRGLLVERLRPKNIMFDLYFNGRPDRFKLAKNKQFILPFRSLRLVSSIGVKGVGYDDIILTIFQGDVSISFNKNKPDVGNDFYELNAGNAYTLDRDATGIFVESFGNLVLNYADYKGTISPGRTMRNIPAGTFIRTNPYAVHASTTCDVTIHYEENY